MSKQKHFTIKSMPKRIWAFVKFIPFYSREMIVSSSILAYDILRPKQSFRHGIVAVDLDLKSDTALLAFINLVSMTPGSLSVDLSADRKKLYVHSMYLDNPEEFVEELKANFEKRIKEIFE